MNNIMANTALDKALDAIYASLKNNHEELDERIAALKAVLQAENMASVEIDSTKIPHPNRQGRKIMESYFRKRGVIVTFSAASASA